MNLTLDGAVIADVDLSRFLPHVPAEYREFFPGEPGREHYKLLAHLSTLYTGVTLVDIGTDAGCSAMALSHNPANRVISYDLVNRRRTDIELPNVEFRVGDALADAAEWLATPLISLDVDHDGTYEDVFYAHLTTAGYKGTLLLDDVYLNDAMRRFWGSITHQKADITPVGHWSGTGIVFFG
ncbi:MAG: hypothetical protein AB7H88_20380 [Vicinamibacterales bacterium]